MKCKTQPAAPNDAMIAGQFEGARIISNCPRCGKNNPADVHTCTPKQDQSIGLNSKQPMSADDILEKFEALGFSNNSFQLRCFIEGVRYTEKYHGIGDGDE